MGLIRNLMKLRRNGYSGPFFMGLILFSVGAQLLLPFDTFSTAESYEAMQDWATEMGWGVVLTALSLHLIYSSIQRKPELVAMGALVAAFGWLIVTVSVGVANAEGILFPITTILTLRCMSLYREFTYRRNDPHLTGPWENADKYPA